MKIFVILVWSIVLQVSFLSSFSGKFDFQGGSRILEEISWVLQVS